MWMFDLIDAATARLFPNAIRNVKPVDLHTANGTTTFNKALKFHVGPLSEDATAFVLPDTPWVLSVGLRCKEMGYGFHWFAYQNPYITLPDGTRIDLEVDGGIPYLNMDAVPYPTQPEAAPATSTHETSPTNNTQPLSEVTVVDDIILKCDNNINVELSKIVDQLANKRRSINKAAPAKQQAKIRKRNSEEKFVNFKRPISQQRQNAEIAKHLPD